MITFVSTESKNDNLAWEYIFSSTALGICLGALQICAFALLRDRLREIYQSRSHIYPYEHLLVRPELSLIKTVIQVWKFLPLSLLQNHKDHDHFFFLRFLRLCCVVCFICLICTAPCLALMISTSIKRSTFRSGLESLTWSSLPPDTNQYGVIFLCICLLTACFCWFINRELLVFFHFKIAILSCSNPDLLSSRTILYRCLSSDTGYCGTFVRSHLEQNMAPIVERIWINRNMLDLETLVKKRNLTRDRLERLITQRMRKYTRWTLYSSPSTQAWQLFRGNFFNYGDKKAFFFHWTFNRTSWKIEKVDSIMFYALELDQLNNAVERKKSQLNTLPVNDSCFVTFKSASDAYNALHCATFGANVQINARIVAPNDVIWENLSLSKMNFKARRIIVNLTCCLLVIFWTPLSTIFGAASKRETIQRFAPGFTLLPESCQWLITGAIPPILSSYLYGQVPSLLQRVLTFGGYSTHTEVEEKVHKYSFSFLFIQSFVTVISMCGLVELTVAIVTCSLARLTFLVSNNMSAATSFYCIFFIMQGLSSGSSVLLQLPEVLNYYISISICSQKCSPRDLFKRTVSPHPTSWATQYAHYTNITVLAVAYSAVAPFLSVLAICSFAFCYCCFKYRAIFVSTPSIGNDGQFYPNAVLQLFTGLYAMQASAMGKFIAQDMIILASLMLLCILGTAVFHNYLVTRSRKMKYLRPSNFKNDCSLSQSPAHHTELVISPLPMFQGLPISFNQLSNEEQESQLNNCYISRIISECKSCVWIPNTLDSFSEAQLAQLSEYNLNVSCEGAHISKTGTISISKIPPDCNPAQFFSL